MDPFGLTTSYDYNGRGQQTSQTVSSADESDPVAGGSPFGAERTMTSAYYPDGSLQSYGDSSIYPVSDMKADWQDQILTADSGSTDITANDQYWTATDPQGASTQGKGYHGATYFRSTGTVPCIWSLAIPETGNYQIYAYFSANSGGDPNASYSIVSDRGSAEPTAATADQTQTNAWVPLKDPNTGSPLTLSFTTVSSNQQVKLTPRAGAPAAVADAIRLVRVPDPNNDPAQPGPEIFTYTYDANGNLAGIDDGSHNPPLSPTNTPIIHYTPTFDSLGQLTKLLEKSSGSVTQ